MFFGMQDFDFCPNRIKFTQILTNFAQNYPNVTRILPKLSKFYLNLPIFCPNLT